MSSSPSLATLVTALLSNDNASRSNAEQHYQTLVQQNPALVLHQMIQLLGSSPEIPVRALSAVLARKLFSGSSPAWSQADAQMRNSCKEELLKLVVMEPVHHVRHKIGGALAQLAACIQNVEKTQWQELLGTVLTLTQQADPQKRVAAFDLVNRVADYAPEVLFPHNQQLHGLFGAFLTDPSHEVQVAVLKAVISLLLAFQDAEQLQPYQPMVPPMLKIIEALLNQGDELIAREALQSLVDIASVHPKFLRPSLTEVGRAMLFIASSDTLDSGTRELAVEFLVSISESAGGMVRKASWLVEAVVPMAMRLICELEDDEEWVRKFDDPRTFSELDDDEECVSQTGSAAIDRLANALGGKAVLPVALPVINGYLSSEDWHQRRAALSTVCLLGEGCKSQLYPYLSEIVPAAVRFCRDPSPRVRHAAIHCLGQMADDFGEVDAGQSFQARFSSIVIPELIHAMQANEQIPRIQAIAASALINFCTPHICRASYIVPYLDQLLSVQFQLLSGGVRQIQEQVITSIACIAKVVQDQFLQYYDIFMPIAKEVLVNAKGKDYALLRGKAMESIGLIGQAVGEEKFRPDAHQVMQILLSVQGDELDTVESQYVAQACARIGNVLKDEFLQYIPAVLPPLLHQAKREPDVQVVDLDELNEQEQQDPSVQHVALDVEGVGRTCVSINTSSIEEKTTACNMLYQYALDLEGSLAPYVDEIANVLLPLIEFPYAPTIRAVSAMAIPRLIFCSVDGCLKNKADNGHPQTLFNRTFGPLLNALQQEEDLEALSAVAESISSSLEICYEQIDSGISIGIPEQMLEQVVQVFVEIANTVASQIMQRSIENAQNEDFDEASAEQQEEEEELEQATLTCMIDSIGWIMKVQKAAFLPILQQHVLPLVLQIVSVKSFPQLRSQAICVMDDVVEHCGPEGHPLLSELVPHILEGIEKSYPSVLQASSYGVGVCAEHAGPFFDQFTVQSLENLFNVINDPHARETPESSAATDNAISAVRKICLHRPHVLDTKAVWPTWLAWLPLQTDLIEAREVHGWLVDAVMEGSEILLGENFSNLPALLRAFADILVLQEEEGFEDDEDSIIAEETRTKLFELLNKLQQQAPANVVQGAWSTLSGEQQAVFRQ